MDSGIPEQQDQIGSSQPRILNKQDIIRLKENVEATFTGYNWTLKSGGETARKPTALLKTLEIFSQWISIEDGLKKIAEGCNDKAAFLSASEDFRQLLEAGFFKFRDSSKATFGFHNARFDSFPVHVRMLNDTARTLAYQKAIRATVTPEDIVLDIGTGNGILAATAAMHGAKHVYAVEKTDFIEVARAVFEANGLSERITLIKGNSTRVELPEKATVLVSEIIGNDPYDEGILHTYKDAKLRLLAPNARIIPSALKIFALAVEIPAEKYNHSQVSEENISFWKEIYGVDFSSFLQYADENPVRKGLRNDELKDCKILSEAVQVSQVNFHDTDISDHGFEGELVISEAGKLNGILIYFEAELSEGNTLSLSPEKISLKNSWAIQCYCLPKEKQVRKNETIHFSAGKLIRERRQIKVVY